MSLRRRLMVLLGAVLLLSLLGGGVLTYWHAVRKIEIEMASALKIGEQAVQDAVAPLADVDDPQAQLIRLVKSFDGDRHMRIALIAPSGTVVMQSRTTPPANPAPVWLQSALNTGARDATIALPARLAEHGQLRLEADPQNEISEVWEDIALKIAILAGFYALVIALVSATLRWALRPLEKLSSALVEVGHGNFETHVPESGPLELVTLYKEFNRMADQLAAAEAKNQQLNEQLSTVQEEERADIARDLHDEIGPFLFAVGVDAETIPQYLQRGASSEVTSRAAAIRQSVAHMQGHLRAILGRLRPAMHIDLGLAHAVDQLVAFWASRHPDLVIDVDVAQESFGREADEASYRIIQESLSNAVRHGKPTRIGVTVSVSDADVMQIVVIDNGSGLGTMRTNGFGLPGMRERMAALGGSLSVTDNGNANGVTVCAEMPLDSKRSAVARRDKLEMTT
ncbi:MAG: HAMP domain-containing protein [Hyphomicrobium sp.]